MIIITHYIKYFIRIEDGYATVYPMLSCIHSSACTLMRPLHELSAVDCSFLGAFTTVADVCLIKRKFTLGDDEFQEDLLVWMGPPSPM